MAMGGCGDVRVLVMVHVPALARKVPIVERRADRHVILRVGDGLLLLSSFRGAEGRLPLQGNANHGLVGLLGGRRDGRGAPGGSAAAAAAAAGRRLVGRDGRDRHSRRGRLLLPAPGAIGGRW